MLETERLILRPWNRDDLDDLYLINSDPVVMQYFEKPLTRPESDTMLVRLETLQSEWRIDRDHWTWVAQG